MKFRNPFQGLTTFEWGLWIVLWVLASFDDPSYLAMVACFAVFLLNDIYGFVNWKRMQKKQKKQ